MSTKSILLAYATRFGSTQEVAEAIAAEIREAGIEVDLKPMLEVESLDGYDAVVLGAALYSTRWHDNAHQFLKTYQEKLMQLPVAIFALGPISAGATAMQNSRRQLDKELGKYRWLKPDAVEMFAGKYDPSKLGFFYKFKPARDYRDWNSIRAWAKTLVAQLTYGEMVHPAYSSAK